MNRLSIRCASSLITLFAAGPAWAADIVFWDDFESLNCPAGRMLTSGIGYWNSPGIPIIDNVDTTQWDTIWGRVTPDSAITPWPGPSDNTIIFTNFIRTGYIAARFTVSPGTSYSGRMNHGSYAAGANLTATISTRCGDFTHVEATCRVVNSSTGDRLMSWETASPNRCHLPAGDYYLNIKLTDPTQVVNGCNNLECYENVQSTWQ